MLQKPTISFIKIPATLVNLARNTSEYNDALAVLEKTHPIIFNLINNNYYAANNGGWFAINNIDDQIENPIIVSDLVDKEGGQLQGPALIMALGKLMISATEQDVFLCTLQQIETLTDSVIWKLWSKQIEDKAELEAAYESIFNKGLDLRKNIETLKQQCADDIKELIQ
jgi:hypothetical protein